MSRRRLQGGFSVVVGVHQGSILSPMLTVLEALPKEFRET